MKRVIVCFCSVFFVFSNTAYCGYNDEFSLGNKGSREEDGTPVSSGKIIYYQTRFEDLSEKDINDQAVYKSDCLQTVNRLHFFSDDLRFYPPKKKYGCILYDDVFESGYCQIEANNPIAFLKQFSEICRKTNCTESSKGQSERKYTHSYYSVCLHQWVGPIESEEKTILSYPFYMEASYTSDPIMRKELFHDYDLVRNGTVNGKNGEEDLLQLFSPTPFEQDKDTAKQEEVKEIFGSFPRQLVGSPESIGRFYNDETLRRRFIKKCSIIVMPDVFYPIISVLDN